MRHKLIKKDLFPILLIIILSFPAIKTLLVSGFFESHDGSFHLVRLFHFYESLKQGHFPVRWSEGLNNNYGYPIFNFVYPLLYYLGSLIHWLGFSLGGTLKIIIAISFIFSGIFIYLWLKEFFKRIPAFLGAIFYIYAPYRFVSAYVSGRMGEVTAYIFIPLCFYTFTKFAKKPEVKNLLTASFAYGLLILSYNVSALIFSPILITYLIFLLFLEKKFNKENFLKIGFLIILSYSLTAFFWVPALLEQKYVRFSHFPIYDYKTSFPSFKSYLYHPWGYGFDTTGIPGGVSHQVGVGQLLITVITIVFLIRKFIWHKTKKKKITDDSSLLIFFSAWFLVVFFMMNKVSIPFWEFFSAIKTIQFPFRLLSIIILIISFFTGYVLNEFKKRKVFLFSAFMVLLSILFYANRNYLRPGFFERYSDEHYLKINEVLYGTTDVAAENTPIWNKERLLGFGQKIEIESGEGKIFEQKIKPRFYQFTTDSNQDIKVRVNTLFYPGWQLFIDGKKVPIDYQNDVPRGLKPAVSVFSRLIQGIFSWLKPREFLLENKEGLIKFSVKPNRHQITLKFTETPLRKIVNIVSLSSFLLMLYQVSKLALKRQKLVQKNHPKKV